MLVGDAPGSEDDSICRQLTPVFESKPALREAFNLTVVLEFDLPVNDHLARPDIYGDSDQLPRDWGANLISSFTKIVPSTLLPGRR